MIAADYPFLDVFWTILVFFVWVAWFMLLFRVIGDIFRRDDLSGLGKTGWLIFAIVLPFLGVFIYLITQNEGMTQREIDRVRTTRAQYDEQIRSVAGGGGATAEIEKGKQLLDSGAITQAEYDALKQRALA